MSPDREGVPDQDKPADGNGSSHKAGKRRNVGHRAAKALRERPRARRALIGGSIAVVALGVLVWHYESVRESTDDAFVDGPIVSVAPRVAGTIVAVHVVENQTVRKGDVLVELDPRDYKLAVEKAQADFAAAEAAAHAAAAQVPVTTAGSTSGMATARARVQQAQAAFDAAAAHLDKVRADADKATQDVERYRQLVEKQEIPRQVYEHAVAADRSARATVTEAEQQLAAAKSRGAEAQAALSQAASGPHQVEATEAQSNLAQAKVAQARAALDLARSHLEDTVVKAPADGRIGKKNAEPGETVQEGEPLLALVPTGQVWITANFKETQIGAMRPGEKVSIYVDALDAHFEGHVASLGAATGSKFSLLPPENATGNFVKVVQRIPVRIELDPGQDPEQRLRPGLSVVPTVITG